MIGGNVFQYKDSGIILKSQDFFETDRILTILTQKKGKIRAIAKGIRRPIAKLSGSLELFSYCNFIIVEGKRDLDIITGAEIISSYQNLKKDLKKTSAVFFISEVIDKLIAEKEAHLNIFLLIKKSLNKLNSVKSGDLELLVNYVIINILSDLGYQPEIKICQNCQTEISASKIKNHQTLFFSPKMGGVLCFKCSSSNKIAMPISIESLKVLKLFLEYDINIIDKISPKDKRQLSNILEFFIEYISEKKINSSKFYKLINHQGG